MQSENAPETPEILQPTPGIEYVDKLAKFQKLFNFAVTPHLRKITSLPHNILFALCGNQGGKTANFGYEYVLRVLGLHPIPEKNRLAKNIRCLSSSLPASADENEQDNTQYLELKKLIPYEMILKDITSRSSTMVVSSPTHGKSYFEFMSTKQELQDTGKVQRCSLWCDEEPPRPYWDESRMRLLARGGDTRLSLTPVNGLSWTYDDLYKRASYIWRSKAIRLATGEPKEEFFDTGDKNIAVVHMATDDNPTLSPEMIEMIFQDIDDPDVLKLRRYGIFAQVSGKVHKAYDPRIHYISFNRYFPSGIPYEWKHSRGIDYHESRLPWSVGWMSASPDDEWFLWQEFHPAIDGPHSMTTPEIAKSIVRRSADMYYLLNLIDPLANKKQANTGFSVTEDMNRIFEELRRDEGIGTPTYWEGWDTKDTKGRDEIRRRFKNAAMVGKPFSNVTREHGITKKLPTLWICDTCPEFNKSIQRWSYEEWATSQSKAVNDAKSTPQAKWSHDNMVLECLAKDHRLKYFERYVPHETRYSQTGRPM
jgi:hypothetical protein